MTQVSSAGKSQIKYVFAEEDEIGIDRDGIKRLVAIAEEVKAQGLHPIFVMDSYRALLAASSIEIEENSSRYANPLRQLKKALGKTGSTVVLLHHSSRPAPSARPLNPMLATLRSTASPTKSSA